MKVIPSFVFAAIGVALVVLGVAGMAYGASDRDQAISAIVAALGVIQVIFGALKRRGEDEIAPVTERDA